MKKQEKGNRNTQSTTKTEGSIPPKTVAVCQDSGDLVPTKSNPSGTIGRTRRVRCAAPDGCDAQVSSAR
ncbi:MAG: hypothetical protein IJR02_03065 [Bacteroidaceae bacterium]|nr:hypothetical protein [Bacteroidaceae bacterium]